MTLQLLVSGVASGTHGTGAAQVATSGSTAVGVDIGFHREGSKRSAPWTSNRTRPIDLDPGPCNALIRLNATWTRGFSGLSL